MNTKKIEDFLQQTIGDLKVSRSERRVLAKSLASQMDSRDRSLLRHRVFEMAESRLIDPDSKAILTWVEDIVKVLYADGSEPDDARSEALFTGEHDCAARIGNLIDMCRSSLEICVFTITDDRISQSIAEAHQRGIQVRIITDDDKAGDLGSDIGSLRRLRLPVATDRSEGHMHHKYAIFDDTKILTGSYNWTRGASLNNEENIVITDDANLVAAFRRHFESLWKKYA